MESRSILAIQIDSTKRQDCLATNAAVQSHTLQMACLRSHRTCSVALTRFGMGAVQFAVVHAHRPVLMIVAWSRDHASILSTG